MKNSEITVEQFNKLKPVTVKNMYGTFTHYRLVRRNKRWTTLAFLDNCGESGCVVLTVLYKNDYVTINQPQHESN